MHEAKLLARLNPAVMRYGPGRGGKPELTAQDIAGALAFVPRGIGRELLCYVWWPAGAESTECQLDRAIEHVQREEWARQVARRVEAHNQGRQKAKFWPSWFNQATEVRPQYAAIRKAVLAELRSPALCPACGGRGQLQADNLVVICEPCRGTGRGRKAGIPVAIGTCRSSYYQRWQAVHDWTLALCAHELAQAACKMRAATS